MDVRSRYCSFTSQRGYAHRWITQHNAGLVHTSAFTAAPNPNAGGVTTSMAIDVEPAASPGSPRRLARVSRQLAADVSPDVSPTLALSLLLSQVFVKNGLDSGQTSPPQASMVFCEDCGNWVRLGKFCQKCGTKASLGP